MSLQSDAMVELAGDNKYITAYQIPQVKKWHGILMVNHPTPSGCDRWMMAYSDKRQWDSHNVAIDEFTKLVPEWNSIKKVYEKKSEAQA